MRGKKYWEIGGFLAGAVLILFGVVAIFMGISGYRTVHDELNQQYIVGSSDMTPAAIKSEAQQAKLSSDVALPTCDVAGQTIDNGSKARCFAQYMRIHALEATGGLTYAEMGRYATTDGKPVGTNDATKAVQKNGQPVSNSARDIWVTETALTTALNMSYMASQLSLFSIVVGVALLISGVGFVILAYAALHQSRKAAGEPT